MIQEKKTITIFIHYYLPGYKSGGPVKSIANIVKHLGNDLDFRIITLGWDLKDRTPYKTVNLDAWNSVGKAQVWYCGKNIFSYLKILRELRKLKKTTVYLNSLFDPLFTFFPLLAIKLGLLNPSRLIIAPRGELSPGAFNLKRQKKKLYLMLFEFLGFNKKTYWHASTEIEKLDIMENIHHAHDIYNACDLSALPAPAENSLSGNSLVFISRITPKKNLSYALRTLKLVRSHIEFHIYGTIEDEGYWQECEAIIKELPANIAVHFHGPLMPSEVTHTLQKYSLFFFPTLGENYGHVIAESLCAGLPILLSDQTPWNDVENFKAGWIKKLDYQEDFALAIDHFFSLSAEERKSLNQNVRDYASKKLFNQNDIEDNYRLFLK